MLFRFYTLSLHRKIILDNMDIKGVAKAHDVTLVALAERLGVSRQTVHYYIEQGEKNSIAQLRRIAEAIGCDLDELIGQKKADFIAFVRVDGQTYTFENMEALRVFVLRE